MHIPIIDIFAGPGGLAEGFSTAHGAVRFSVKLSIEKDEIAHRTLQLRAFLRSFGHGTYPSEYYDYIRGNITKEQLFSQYPVQARKAVHEAWQIELGPRASDAVHQRLKQVLGETKHWVLIGGPPCQAYSLVGRARMTGLGIKGRELEENESHEEQLRLKNKKINVFNKDHRHNLYKEYLKIVAVHKPTVFVMENVKGILSSKQGGKLIFEKILSDLKDPWSAIDSDRQLRNDISLMSRRPQNEPKYRLFSFVSGQEPDEKDLGDYIIRSEKYGIPQRRHRVIILGVLEKYDVNPEPLTIDDNALNVIDAIGDLPKLRSGLSKEKDSAESWKKAIRRGFTASQLNTIEADIKYLIRDAFLRNNKLEYRGNTYIPGSCITDATEFSKWVCDSKIKGTIQHETRGHMASDLWRYLFAAAYAAIRGQSPTLEHFPHNLLPEHKNVLKGQGRRRKKIIHFKDRFKVQVGHEPATTITSHISKDGHYYIHYDPAQCRSLTVREAARLQTFPDNYFFEGNRTEQYHQVGNAVPPLLARKLAQAVSGVLDQCIQADKVEDRKLARTGEKVRA